MVHEMYHKLWQHIWWADNSAWNIPFFELYISFAIGAFKIYRNHLQFFWYTNESTLHIPKIQEYFWCTERVQMMYWNLLLLLHFWAGCAVFSTLNTLFIFQSDSKFDILIWYNNELFLFKIIQQISQTLKWKRSRQGSRKKQRKQSEQAKGDWLTKNDFLSELSLPNSIQHSIFTWTILEKV